MLNVIIPDYRSGMRAVIRSVLEFEPSIKVLGEYGDCRGAVQMARRLRPDVAVLDSRLAGLNGIEAARLILGRQPEVAVVIVTADDAGSLESSGLPAGVAAVIERADLAQQLVPAVYAAARRVRDMNGLAYEVTGMQRVSSR